MDRVELSAWFIAMPQPWIGVCLCDFAPIGQANDLWELTTIDLLQLQVVKDFNLCNYM